MKRLAWYVTSLLSVASIGAPVSAQSRNGLLHFTVNGAETKITATVAEPMAWMRGNAAGNFTVVKGEVQGDPDSIANTGKVQLVIDATSYKTDSASRDKDVKENSLEVQRFPTITFNGDGFPAIDKDGELAAQLRLLGKLTLHGVTKDIVLPLRARIDERGRFIADGTYAFRFEAYGVKRPSKMMGMMVTGDEATIAFHVVADPA
jgi:polyisoprenoid-binding protein YceI